MRDGPGGPSYFFLLLRIHESPADRFPLRPYPSHRLLLAEALSSKVGWGACPVCESCDLRRFAKHRPKAMRDGPGGPSYFFLLLRIHESPADRFPLRPYPSHRLLLAEALSSKVGWGACPVCESCDLRRFAKHRPKAMRDGPGGPSYFFLLLRIHESPADRFPLRPYPSHRLLLAEALSSKVGWGACPICESCDLRRFAKHRPKAMRDGPGGPSYFFLLLRIHESPADRFPLRPYPSHRLLLADSRFRGILAYITYHLPKMFGVSYNAIKTLLLPKRPSFLNHFVDVPRRPRLPAAEDFLQTIAFLKRSNHSVNVIRHQDKSTQLVSLSVEGQKRFTHHLANLGALQLTASHASIKPAFRFLHGRLGQLLPLILLLPNRFRVGGWFSAVEVFLSPFLAKRLQFVEFGLREGICLSKSNEIGRAVLPPMRKMAMVDGEITPRIKRLETGRRFEVKHKVIRFGAILSMDGSGGPSYHQASYKDGRARRPILPPSQLQR